MSADDELKNKISVCFELKTRLTDFGVYKIPLLINS